MTQPEQSDIRPSKYYDAFMRDQLAATKGRRNWRPRPHETMAVGGCNCAGCQAIRRGL